MTFGFWLPGGAELLILLVMLLATAFWAWMLVDCALNQSLQGNNKVFWVIVVALTFWLGALLYFFIRRAQRSAA